MDHEEWDVIVVGAGASGIGAATLLHKYEGSYVVLEGRKRVGGRVKSVEVDGVEVDLGACWVHSYSAKNPLRPEIKKLGWRQTVLDKATVGRRYIDEQSGKCFCKEVW
jgi:phytoene dehydrogenase-like protein